MRAEALKCVLIFSPHNFLEIFTKFAWFAQKFALLKICLKFSQNFLSQKSTLYRSITCYYHLQFFFVSWCNSRQPPNRLDKILYWVESEKDTITHNIRHPTIFFRAGKTHKYFPKKVLFWYQRMLAWSAREKNIQNLGHKRLPSQQYD